MPRFLCPVRQVLAPPVRIPSALALPALALPALALPALVLSGLFLPAMILSALILPGLVLVSPAAAQQQPREPDHHLVIVKVADARHMIRLLKLELDLASCTRLDLGSKEVEVIATDADIRRIKEAGFRYTVAIRKLEEHYERDLAKHYKPGPLTLTPALGQGAMGGHYTLAQMEAILDKMHKDHPKLCAKKVSIGKTIENRDIWMVKISDNVVVDENEPEMLYDALHHAREPLSMETTILFMDELLDGYGKDPEATFIVNERELYFVPCLNPDGYEYNRKIRPNGGGMWRKNRRKNANNSYGVDLNRNYATAWNSPNGGASSNPNSDIYRGTKAFSEPETAAIEAFAKKHKFTHVNSCHTYTEVLLRPMGWKRGEPQNGADYKKLGTWLTAQNGMNHGPAANLLYIASGTALDHHHTARGSYSWTPELGRSSEGGFWPNATNIPIIARRQQHMFRTFALTAGPYLNLLSVAVSEGSGSNNNGRVEAGETGRVVVTVQNQGLLSMSRGPLVTLAAVSSGLQLGNSRLTLAAPQKLATVDNQGTPLTFSIPKTYGQPIAELKVTVAGGGQTLQQTLRLLLVPLGLALDHDMEKDRGFLRGASTARTGRWERAVPQQTRSGNQTIQPGNQHTKGGRYCWITDARAGSSAGSYDVDGGYTDLVSPVMQLGHLKVAELSFFRWYVDSASDDPFEVFLSSDGGVNWSKIFADTKATTAWTRLRYEITSGLTDRMQFRVRAQDLNASLVEAGIDDLEIRGVTPDGTLTVLSSGKLQSYLRLGMAGSPNSTSWLIVGTKTTNTRLPGFSGTLRLDPQSSVLLNGVSIPNSGYRGNDVWIPNMPSLIGVTFYMQQLFRAGSRVGFGNLQAVKVR